jgi:hypothetical protein
MLPNVYQASTGALCSGDTNPNSCREAAMKLRTVLTALVAVTAVWVAAGAPVYFG